jgi:hypothetical protein
MCVWVCERNYYERRKERETHTQCVKFIFTWCKRAWEGHVPWREKVARTEPNRLRRGTSLARVIMHCWKKMSSSNCREYLLFKESSYICNWRLNIYNICTWTLSFIISLLPKFNKNATYYRKIKRLCFSFHFN